eukprot:CAMPEP_0174963214 /NCGR_PEP_ID=MMETSP0004_2-20121128/5204_1 /TAXON_ID=420556 /ORGANISM="Ochromonas sp., Strain CCMP1393" /LENGTH=65 /DNA_ID=CAMNT_0016211811 /DNA_START=54 /DNA_END=251 /DNA_ORIENTATION=+
MPETTAVARKPRRSGFWKYAAKYNNKVMALAVPGFRYALMPALFYYAIYFTEPQPTFLELVNPFW